MAAASEEFVEEDVNRLQFGKDFGTAEFLSNTEVSLILETLKTQKYARTNQRPPEYVVPLDLVVRCISCTLDPWIIFQLAVKCTPCYAPRTPYFGRVFNKALEYATNHMGAVQISDPAAIDELFTALRQMSFDRASEDEDGPLLKLSLQNFQVWQYMLLCRARHLYIVIFFFSTAGAGIIRVAIPLRSLSLRATTAIAFADRGARQLEPVFSCCSSIPDSFIGAIR